MIGSSRVEAPELVIEGATLMLTSFEYFTAWAVTRLGIKSDKGASLVEYALLVALIAVVCIAAVTLLGRNASNKFSSVASAIK